MKIIILTFLLSGLTLCGFAQFVHPGMMHNKQDLAFLKEKINAREKPWITLWSDLQKAPAAALTWTPKPRKVIVVGFYSKPDIGATDFKLDGEAAYTLALQFYVLNDISYAKKAVDIINAWSYTLDSVTDNNKKLLLGITGIQFLNAAEILRSYYPSWEKKDREAFEKMALTIWYPLIQDFMPGYNGNWDAAIAQTMMCIGIFCDRKDIFDRAYEQILKGASNGAVNNYINDAGQCQESGRDQGHTQMGLGYLGNVCEIAWKQGQDLYSAYNNRLAKGYEYTAKYMLGEDVKYVQYKTFQGKMVFGDSISRSGRGQFSPVYERVYHHYHNRMGMEMPYTRRALEASRPEGSGNLFLPWASLTTIGFPIKINKIK